MAIQRVNLDGELIITSGKIMVIWKAMFSCAFICYVETIKTKRTKRNCNNLVYYYCFLDSKLKSLIEEKYKQLSSI